MNAEALKPMEPEPASPLVSVLIATYNKAGTLRLALESVLWQTLQDFEVWVIGDGCTDDSAAVVASFNDPRLHWFNLPKNSGYQSVPHNEGLRRARGKYIAYLNHDDIWLPEHLTLLVEALEKSDANFAYSLMEWISHWRPPFTEIPITPFASFVPEASATLQRRSIVAEIGFWKQPQESVSYPREEYFRRAQFAGSRFELVPALTVLKFASAGDYNVVALQQETIARFKSDPKFAEKELAALLVQAAGQLEGPLRLKGLAHSLANSLRLILVRLKIDPARLRFWKRPGVYTRGWRRGRHLD